MLVMGQDIRRTCACPETEPTVDPWRTLTTRSNQLRSSSSDMAMVGCRCDCVEKLSWNGTGLVLAPHRAQSNRFLMYKEFPKKTKADLYIKQWHPIIVLLVQDSASHRDAKDL